MFRKKGNEIFLRPWPQDLWPWPRRSRPGLGLEGWGLDLGLKGEVLVLALSVRPWSWPWVWGLGLGLEGEALVLALTVRPWSWPWVWGLGLGLKTLSSTTSLTETHDSQSLLSVQLCFTIFSTCLYWTVFAWNRDTALPAEGNGDLQTLICVLAARPRRCPTLSNPVLWQSWMAAYPSYTLQMKTLFPGWPIMVHYTHTRRRIRRLSSLFTIDHCALLV